MVIDKYNLEQEWLLEKINSYKSLLEKAINQLRDLTDRNNELVSEYNKLLNIGKKNSEIHEKLLEKHNELKILFSISLSDAVGKGIIIKERDKEIEKLKEELIDYKIEDEERKLEIFVKELGIDRARFKELRNAYKRLMQFRENGGQSIIDDEEIERNQDNINDAEDDIEIIKDELLDNGWFKRSKNSLSLENVRELCSKCEKFAELRIEREKLYQKEFEAKQEVANN